MSYKYGGEAKRQKKDISAKKNTNPAKDGNPPSRKDENSSQRKPNHLVYSTPSSSPNWDIISAGGGRTNYFFLGAAFFMAPRRPQLATKMAPAFLGLAGALHKARFPLTRVGRRCVGVALAVRIEPIHTPRNLSTGALAARVKPRAVKKSRM